jgi:hypothetical protein
MILLGAFAVEGGAKKHFSRFDLSKLQLICNTLAITYVDSKVPYVSCFHLNLFPTVDYVEK